MSLPTSLSPDGPAGRPVVVIGAGPTGLTLAGLLGASRVPTVLVERNPTTSAEPKAISCDDETLRALQRAHLSHTLDDVLVPGVGTRYLGRRGQTLVFARGPEPARFGHPVKSPFAQPDFERELLAGIRAGGGVDVRLSTRLEMLTPHDDHVTVHVSGPSGDETIDASFVVGCDGGSSTVRGLLPIRMNGESFTDRWLVIDTRNDRHDGRYALHVGDPSRPHVIVAGRGGACRYEFFLRDAEAPGNVADHALVRELMAPYRSIEPEEVVRQTVYTFHALVADRFRCGRCFIAGDAAHMMPPFAGQGMNSGIRDVDNLAWKLARVWWGLAPEALLDTYEPERRPHVTRMVELSVRLGRVVMTRSPARARVRDAIIRGANLLPGSRRWLSQMRFRPRPHYVSAATTDIGGVDGPLLGRMFPQPLVMDAAGRVSLLDEHLGDGFGVVVIDPSNPLAIAAFSGLAESLGAPLFSLLLEDRLPWVGACASVLHTSFISEFRPLRGHALLLRPDRYVAAIASVGSVAAVRSWANGAFGLHALPALARSDPATIPPSSSIRRTEQS